MRRLLDMRRSARPRLRVEVVWLDGSRNPAAPIQRRWRVVVCGWIVLSVPMTTVEWSR